MSLANLIVQPTRAVLQADAGAYWPDGRIAWLRSKIWCFGQAKAAITMRGGVHRPFMDKALRGADRRPLADLLNILPTALAASTDRTRESFEGSASASLTIAAYCAVRRRPIGLLLTNDRNWFGGAIEAYALHGVNNAVGTGDATLSELLGRAIEMADLSDPSRFDIERDSLPLIAAQRARPWGDWAASAAGNAVAVRIGGWIDQAEVTESGVAMKRLIKWPDRVGERIAA